MKISTQNQSRFLSHDDVRTPIIVTMQRVTEDRSLRNPFVLHFAPDHKLKPLPLNVTNRRIIVAAFGDDDAAWHGREIELYFNPSIPNPRTPSLPGGICVRVPSGPGTSAPGSRPAAAPVPAPKPTTPPSAPTPPRPANGNGTAAATKPATVADKKAQALEAFRRATTTENAGQWMAWVRGQRFDDADLAELKLAFAAAMERLIATATKRPTPPRS